MSTNIADLPGPLPEDIEEVPQHFEQQRLPSGERPQNDNRPEFNGNIHETDGFYAENYMSQPKEVYYEQPSSIKMDIKKVNKNQKEEFGEQGIFDMLRREINEENLLVLIILFIATTPYTDEYTKKFLSLFSFNTNSSFTFNIIKCLLLLLIFILVKIYILPQIKL
jgi:hypothetical protein